MSTDGRVIDATFRWNGADSPATDYDLACDVALAANLGLISISDLDALVLGGEVPMSAWIEHPSGTGGIPLEWWGDSTDDDLLHT